MRRLALPLACFLYASSSFAQGGAGAIAENLYNEGRKLLEENKIAEACDKFAKSQQVEPAAGTLFALATCHEKDKKIASAWYEYELARKEYAKTNSKPEKQEFCASKVNELAPHVQRLPMSMPSKPEGVSISIDGQALGEGPLLGATPIDQGEHTILVKAPNKKRWEKKVTITMGNAPAAIVIPELQPATPGDPEYQVASVAGGGGTGTGGTGTVGTGTGNGAGARRIVETEPDYTKRTIGFVVGGVGVAAGITALIVQVGFALPADRQKKIANDILSGTVAGEGGATFEFDKVTGAVVNGSDAIAQKDVKNCEGGCTFSQWQQVSANQGSAAKNNQIVALSLGIGGAVAVGVGIFLIATSGGTKQVETGNATPQKVKVQPYFTYNSAGLVGSF